MNLLTLNTGSSSVRLAVFGRGADGALMPLASGHFALARHEPQDVLRRFLDEHALRAMDVAAHRVVHGGARLQGPCVIDPGIEAEIERLIPLAPLHNPVALAWIRAARAVLGAGVPQVAVFDTAFYAVLPEVARTYAIPRALAAKHGLRRFGFHGLAHEAMWRRWRELRPEVPDGGRVISLQLGAGCSMTAIRAGRPLDTSMGFSPTEGLMMATRSGDVDPGLITYLQQHEGLTPAAIEELLNRESGLLGVAGEADMRALLARDDADAKLAFEMYCRRARKYLGAYLALLGGADAVLFGGGVGENAPAIRERILAGMEWAGIALDAQRNAAAAGTEARITGPNSHTQAWVIPVDEAAILAQAAAEVISTAGTLRTSDI
jgi:acetate kinase